MSAASDFSHNPDYQAQRREIIRRYHPDHGGNAGTLAQHLAALDAAWAAASTPPVPTPPMAARLARGLHRITRGASTRMVASFDDGRTSGYTPDPIDPPDPID